MKIDLKNPPRRFSVGKKENNLHIDDCGSVYAEADEQLTFFTENGAEYDVARKDWGFYATPSLNARLLRFNLRTVLIRNRESNNFFILLVEKGKESAFDHYLTIENLEIVTWLDSTEQLEKIQKCLQNH